MTLAPFRLQAFGPFRVTDCESREVKFPAKSACSLLAYLAVQRQSMVSRSQVAENLWPDNDPTAARTNLRTAIHRVKKSLGDRSVFVEEDRLIGLDRSLVETDIARAHSCHQRQLFASTPEETLDALRNEWQIVKQQLLQGWDDDWVCQERTFHEIRAVELGCELAKLLDEADERAEALEVLKHLLSQAPHRIDALEHAIQLEYSLTGPNRALDLVAEASGRLAADIGVELPQSIKKVVRAIRNGVYEPAPRPGVFKSRSELVILSRMFEENLRSNGSEALKMLSTECMKPLAWQHPKTTFAIIQQALDSTVGASPERVELAVRSLAFASWLCEFDEGHRHAEFALQHLSENDPIYCFLLVFNGFMYFEQRDYERARDLVNRSLEISRRHGRRFDELSSMSAIAGIDWHQLEFDRAELSYLEIVESTRGTDDPIGLRLYAQATANLCFLYTFTSKWEAAVKYGLESQRCSAESVPVISMANKATLGFSKLMCGDKEKGLDFISEGVQATLATGMRRYNQLALDFALSAMSVCGKRDWARCLFEAAAEHRGAISHQRSPAEGMFLSTIAGIDQTKGEKPSFNPLLGQSPGALCNWTCDSLRTIRDSLSP